MKKAFLLLLNLACLVWLLHGQTAQPILRLNTTMHSAMINRISTDTQGKYILTASKDKTAKLWDANTGELIRTFRPPVGTGDEGMLYACALSPDASVAAVGGWSKDDDIYIFNTATGDMMQRISGLANVINDLEFSADGKYLVAALGGREGVQVLVKNPTGFESYTRLRGYGAASYNVGFDKTGRLATVCYDGYLRLYDNGFNKIKEIRTSGGHKPFSLAFSPDGGKLAIGYDDNPTIEVYDGYSLSLLYKPDITGADNTSDRLDKVSFSTDGRYLFGGGVYSLLKNGIWWRQIRRWDNAGKGAYSDFDACRNRVMDIKPMPDNSIIFGGSQPDFGRIKADGTKLIYKEAELNDFRNSQFKYLKINDDGSLISFTPNNKSALYFSLKNKQLSTSLSGFENLSSFIDQCGNTKITDWENNYQPKLNGSALSFLKTNEISRSMDISDNGQSIVFGADWDLYCLNAQGTSVWQTATQAEVWAVNIANNNSSVLAACGDGTIRWYSMSDGALLLTLFTHPDNQRWVLWTPGGYYDCATGAEDLIGWHINNGADKEASFYPVSKFRSVYYRPDVIDKILQTLDETEAVRLADAENNRKTQNIQITQILPPEISITSPQNNTEVGNTQVTINYKTNTPADAPVIAVKVYIDGRPIETRGFKPVDGITVSIPPQNCNISLVAQNKNGFSEPAFVNIIWKGSKEEDILKPKLYLVAIGISDYNNPNLKLGLAAKDAGDFSKAMQGQQGLLYSSVQSRLLTDKEATKDNILDALDWLQSQTTAKDVAMLFIAGHGMNDNVGTFYFLPVGADPERIKSTCVMFAEIKNTVSSVAGKMILFADACHSGNIMGNRRAAPDLNAMVNELSSAENGVVVFTSSTGQQFSLENPEWGNGAFTKALVEGMNGKADLFRKGKITVKTLDAYITERVKELTQGRQSPTTIIPNSIPDFPIGVAK